MKKILLVSTGQPAGNPRIVKEADTLQQAGFQVTVLYCFSVDWGIEKDKTIFENATWKYIMSGGSPGSNKLVYFFTKIRCKVAGYLNRLMGNRFLLAERTQVRAYDELVRTAKKIKADWYIGHNLGALPVVVIAARYNQANAGFDFEDYHRGEVSTSDDWAIKRMIYLENNYVPFLSYISTSSEMITDVTQNNHPSFKHQIITVRNCFPLRQQPPFKEKQINDRQLKLFWFSQTIGLNRGLEVLIRALKILNDSEISITLAGRCDENFKQYIELNAGAIIPNILFAGVKSPDELPLFASQFDIGMAIELSEPHNRDLCLTNKIFTYLLAGNAIILSETSMQRAFNNQYKIGESFKANDELKLAEKIKSYKDYKKLNKQKCDNFKLANDLLNWEEESKKLLPIFS